MPRRKAVEPDDAGVGLAPPVTAAQRAELARLRYRGPALYATASRTVCFGDPTPEFKLDFEAAVRLSARYRLMSVPGESVGSAAESGKRLSLNGPYEHEWREAQIGYGAGRFHAEELRKAGQDEKFGPGWPIVWQSKIGTASVVDTVLVTNEGPDPMTPTEGWPFKRIRVKGNAVDVPDLLVR